MTTECQEPAAEPAAEPSEALEIAWGIIANAYGGNWDLATEEWREAAIRWRDEHWHPRLPTDAPSAEPATGRDQKMGVTKQEVPSAGGEPPPSTPEPFTKPVRVVEEPPVWDVMTDTDRVAICEDRVTAEYVAAAINAYRPTAPSAGGEPRYTLDEVADMLVAAGATANYTRFGWVRAARWLRSGGATTETGEP